MYIVWAILEDFYYFDIFEFFDRAEIGDYTLGHKLGMVCKLDDQTLRMTIFNALPDLESEDYEYDIDIEKLKKISEEYKKFFNEIRPPEIVIERDGSDFSIKPIYGKVNRNSELSNTEDYEN